MASQYSPDKWVVIFINATDPHYRVFATWSGGYLSGDSWRMNSGITSVEEIDDTFIFHGSSGSMYICHKDSYGTNIYNQSVLQQYIDTLPITVMPEDTDWINQDWIIKA